MKNPFSYGNELGAGQLLDRKSELAQVERTIRDGRKLFMIGPRRFGKTSILKAAEEGLRSENAIVLRFDATAPPTLELLVSRIVSQAAKALSGEAKWVGEQLANFFSMVRPDVKFKPADGEWSVQFGIEREDRKSPMFFVATLLAVAERSLHWPRVRPGCAPPAGRGARRRREPDI